ncbi:DUF6979 family protein [Sphingomonas sp. NCPPB 2930]
MPRPTIGIERVVQAGLMQDKRGPPMEPSKSNYGKTALLASMSAAAGQKARSSWEAAAHSVLSQSRAVETKSCPRNAFLGLAYSGALVGVAQDKRRAIGLNGKYALTAVKVLRASPESHWDPKGLWKEVAGSNLKHNSQMHVVLALWNAQRIKGTAA